jgi:hypothetical protein
MPSIRESNQVIACGQTALDGVPVQNRALRYGNFNQLPTRNTGYPQSTHPRIMVDVKRTRNPVMAKVGRSAASGQFEVTPKSGSKSASITNKETGKTLPLKGYGDLKGELKIRKGIDLTKPIAAQTKSKLKTGTAKRLIAKSSKKK